MVEAPLGRVGRRLKKRRGGVEIRDDNIGLPRAAILQLVPHVRRVLELLLNRSGTRAELLTDRSLRAHRLAVARLVANGVRTTHLVQRAVARVVARRGPVRRRVRLALLADALQHLLGRHGVQQDDVRVLHLEQTQVHHERGEGFTGTRGRRKNDVQRQRRLGLGLRRARVGFVMLIELLQELVLVLVHARRPAGLRAALVRPVVHRLEHLVLDAVGRLVPHNLRRLLLHGPGAVLERFAPEEKMIGRLRLHDGGDPAKRVFPVIAHGFDLVQHGLRPQRLQALLLRLIVRSLLVFLGEALLRQGLPHVPLFALDVKKLKHFVGVQSGRGV